MRKMLSILLALLLCSLPALCASAEAPDEIARQEGYIITAQGIDITLYENGTTGYEWSCEIDDETMLELLNDELSVPKDAGMVGGGSMHTWHFKAGEEDGESLVTFYYERPWGSEDEEDYDEDEEDEYSDEDEEDYDDSMPERILCFTVEVEDGKVVFCEMEDLTEDDNEGDSDDAMETYQGNTGGVELDVFEGMRSEDTPEGTLLTGDGGLTTILVSYKPDENADELFASLKDDESAAKMFDDEEKGIQVVACSVDDDADVPSVLVVYYTPEGIVEYTAYKAPEGGVLHATTTYILDEDESIEYEDDESDDTEPEDSEDGTVG